MHPCQLTAAITAVANTFGNRLTTQELTLLAAVFTQLGDTLATISLQRSICETVQE